MVFLGPVERAERRDLRDDRVAPDFRPVHFRDDLLRGLLLLRRVIKDRGPILRPDVRTLTIEGRRIVDREEDAQDIDERDGLRVECDLDRLRMPRRVRAHGLVRGVCEMAAGISDLDLFDAAEVLEQGLQAPEAAAGDCGTFSRTTSIGHHGGRLLIRFPWG